MIGDLNNYMSDYRTGEGTHLLSNTPAELAASEQDIAGLDAQVTRAQRSYEALPHEDSEQRLYDEFASEWTAYKTIAAQVLGLSHSGVKAEAISMYMSTSRQAFDRASDTLGRLTDQTVSKARQASERAAGAYLHDSRLIVTAMIVATCLVLATIIYITRSVSRPLLNLARRMQALASHDTNISIPGTRRDDEIGEMARSVAVFRDNAIALVQSQQRLIEQAAALETTLEKERRATAQQRNFVTMTSHEFRTPLTVIDAQAQRLIKLKERLTPNDLLERALRIRSAVTRLTGIMDSLLGASLLLDGQAVYRPSDFVPAELLHEVCQLHRETTRNADIREDFAELPSVMLGDRKLLFALFSNLLSNALKYSAPGDPIEVRAYRDTSEKNLGLHTRSRPRDFRAGSRPLVRALLSRRQCGRGRRQRRRTSPGRDGARASRRHHRGREHRGRRLDFRRAFAGHRRCRDATRRDPRKTRSTNEQHARRTRAAFRRPAGNGPAHMAARAATPRSRNRFWRDGGARLGDLAGRCGAG